MQVNLDELSAKEVRLIAHKRGCSPGKVLTHALSLLRIFEQAEHDGHRIILIDPKDPSESSMLRVPWEAEDGE